MLRRVWCLEIACDRDPLACFFFASALRIFSRPEGYDAFTLHRPYSKGLIEIDDMGERPDKSPDQLGDNELGEGSPVLNHISISASLPDGMRSAALRGAVEAERNGHGERAHGAWVLRQSVHRQPRVDHLR